MTSPCLHSGNGNVGIKGGGGNLGGGNTGNGVKTATLAWNSGSYNFGFSGTPATISALSQPAAIVSLLATGIR